MSTTLGAKLKNLGLSAARIPWLLIAGFLLIGGMVVFWIALNWWMGRGDWVYPTQPAADQKVEPALSAGAVLGQTFVADQAGLQGIHLKISTNRLPESGELVLRLYSDPTRETLVRETNVSAGHGQDGHYLAFPFEPIPDSNRAYYYFEVQAEGIPDQSVMTLLGSSLDRYLDGAAYLDHQPQDRQLAFQLNYQRRLMVQAFSRQVFADIPIGLAALLFLLLPGGALLVWLDVGGDWDLIEWLAVTVGVSLGIYPLLLLLLHYTPLTLSKAIVWGSAGILSGPLLYGLWRRTKRNPFRLSNSLNDLIDRPTFIAFWLIFGLSLAVRLWVIRGLAVPLWGDSYQHTMITQLIVDHGRLVSNWEPYAPLQSLNYHTGFHSMTAFFHWFTGLPVTRSILVFGQILNSLAVLMAYLLGKRLGGNAWIGVFAALVTGLISQHPMYYVNWGRYTQLSGQILLPVLIGLTISLLEVTRHKKAIIGVTALIAASLILTHYRVFIFYGCFVLPFLLIRWSQIGWKRDKLIEDVIRLGQTALVGGLLLLPHLIELAGSRLLAVNMAIGAVGATNAFVSGVYNALMSLFDFLPPAVVLLGWAGLLVGVWQRQVRMLVLGFWWGVLFLATNPQLLGLPGAGVITNFAIVISAYLFFSVLAGYIPGQLVAGWSHSKPIVGWVGILLVLAVGGWGALRQARILDSAAIYVTVPDLRAMAWIEAHLPQEARFVVNSQLANGESTVVGTDGGWWLPLLAGRQNTTPPLLYTTEKPPYPDYIREVQTIHELVHAADLSVEQLAKEMAARNLDYVYIGQRRGRVGAGNEIPLEPARFAASEAFELVYAEDGVRILRIASMAP